MDFVNRGVWSNGVLVPAPCNPVDPTIYTTAANVAPDNLQTNVYVESQSGINDPANCFNISNLYSFYASSLSQCSGLRFDCLPGDQARNLMFTIGDAISTFHQSVNPKWRFYCLPTYEPIRPLCCSDPDDGGDCCTDYSSFVEVLWQIP